VDLSRRLAVGMATSVLPLLALLGSGCGDGSSSPRPTDSRATDRAMCRFEPGALPAETLGSELPRGSSIPIDHFVILMQENRSFDHYFGSLARTDDDIDGFPRGYTNPDADGKPVRAFHATDYCIEDVEHSWNDSHVEYNDGRNDGFVTRNDPHGERAMGYLDESDLPFYYGLARTFSTADRYFCSLLGSTFPNRFFFLAATSDGRVDNRLDLFTRTSIYDRLDEAGVSSKVYAVLAAFDLLLGRPQHPISEFYTDATQGTLPTVSMISGSSAGPDQNDEHPPANPQVGQQFVRSIYEALVASPQWPSSALIITYDEHGGFFDHVPPPPACVPDDVPPETEPDDYQATFDRYGFRVPLLVVSPYSNPGHVSHVVYDHTSILRLLEARFDLPALTRRDANATPITDLFDFSAPRLLHPPSQPAATIDPGHAQRCEAFGF